MLQRPQPGNMNRFRKMRLYPPIIVCLSVGIGLAAAAISTISSTAQITADSDKLVVSDSYIVQAAAIPAAMEIPYIQNFENEESKSDQLIKSRDWGSEDSEILLKIAMAEAEGESVKGKALVMLVVLNRTWSDEFPDTIEEVVFQPQQFSPVAEGGRYYTTEPNEDCYEALGLIESGWDESEGALYFESCKGGSWHSENLEYLFQEGNHKFYR